jgi:hypothetical protein
MAAMKILGYFNQDNGGHCKECNESFTTNEQLAALRHFEAHPGWECLHVGTETHQNDRGLVHCTVYHYGTK